MEAVAELSMQGKEQPQVGSSQQTEAWDVDIGRTAGCERLRPEALKWPQGAERGQAAWQKRGQVAKPKCDLQLEKPLRMEVCTGRMWEVCSKS